MYNLTMIFEKADWWEKDCQWFNHLQRKIAFEGEWIDCGTDKRVFLWDDFIHLDDHASCLEFFRGPLPMSFGCKLDCRKNPMSPLVPSLASLSLQSSAPVSPPPPCTLR
eukprot:TRINITY_DN13126_c0_g1_i3.p2 TRINITY_DN13126_c0_g1~~TRINITY_DN13126_c0_g1_i3.p2  ORF type:complete len:109 (-),score=6.70 TRINITY_DN13126_c0_g1_i3:19-345(-)